MKFEVFREKNSGNSLLALGAADWRWRLRAANGQIIATSGEGYINKADCLHGISLVQSVETTRADVVELPPENSIFAAGLGLRR